MSNNEAFDRLRSRVLEEIWADRQSLRSVIIYGEVPALVDAAVQGIKMQEVSDRNPFRFYFAGGKSGYSIGFSQYDFGQNGQAGIDLMRSVLTTAGYPAGLAEEIAEELAEGPNQEQRDRKAPLAVETTQGVIPLDEISSVIQASGTAMEMIVANDVAEYVEAVQHTFDVVALVRIHWPDDEHAFHPDHPDLPAIVANIAAYSNKFGAPDLLSLYLTDDITGVGGLVDGDPSRKVTDADPVPRQIQGPPDALSVLNFIRSQDEYRNKPEQFTGVYDRIMLGMNRLGYTYNRQPPAGFDFPLPVAPPPPPPPYPPIRPAPPETPQQPPTPDPEPALRPVPPPSAEPFPFGVGAEYQQQLSAADFDFPDAGLTAGQQITAQVQAPSPGATLLTGSVAQSVPPAARQPQPQPQKPSTAPTTEKAPNQRGSVAAAPPKKPTAPKREKTLGEILYPSMITEPPPPEPEELGPPIHPDGTPYSLGEILYPKMAGVTPPEQALRGPAPAPKPEKSAAAASTPVVDDGPKHADGTPYTLGEILYPKMAGVPPVMGKKPSTNSTSGRSANSQAEKPKPSDPFKMNSTDKKRRSRKGFGFNTRGTEKRKSFE